MNRSPLCIEPRSTPRFAYSVAAARASGVCDTVFLTTDGAEIAEAGRRCGAEVPFLRPADLAEDQTTTEATLQHTLVSFEKHAGPSDSRSSAGWNTACSSTKPASGNTACPADDQPGSG